MSRVVMCSTLAAAVVLVAAQSALAQGGGAQQAPKPAAGDAAKIANAMLAAPPEIAGKATIMDWPAKEGAAPRTLRKGTNGWVCFPDDPTTKGNDPMCADSEWQKWGDAYMAKKPPQVMHAGVAYMLSGSSEGSNTNPYATGPQGDKSWHTDGPHLMLLVPDAKAYDSYPAEPHPGSPYVMWKGTPYVHLMVPVAGK